jgi:hypothetical protein
MKRSHVSKLRIARGKFFSFREIIKEHPLRHPCPWHPQFHEPFHSPPADSCDLITDGLPRIARRGKRDPPSSNYHDPFTRKADPLARKIVWRIIQKINGLE